MTTESAADVLARYPELLVRITPQGSDPSFRVDLEFTQPGSIASTEPAEALLTLDLAELRSLLNDPPAYARRLSAMFFENPKIAQNFVTARAIAEASQKALRMRLQAATDGPELHVVRWELLMDANGAPLATSERVLFSRYLRSPDWRRVSLRPQAKLRALVIIPNPADLAEGTKRSEGVPLEPLDVPRELALIERALGDMPITALVGARYTNLESTAEVQAIGATSENLVQFIRRGYEIVYFVGHGVYQGDATRLYFEDATGDHTRTVTGQELATELDELRTLPMLMVLAACQSAGTAGKGALAAVGPLLASAGVPAVLAMQERISVESAEIFVEKFFTELRRDGQLDRAASVARSQIKQRPDAWVPVLFTRLVSGCLWPPSTASITEFEQWPIVLRQINDGMCTPVLGPGLLEFLLGTRRDIAQSWADRYRFPMSQHDRQDLPQVAQFLAVNQGPGFPASELNQHLLDELVARYGEQAGQVVRVGRPEDTVRDLAHDVGKRRRAEQPLEPFKLLARLPFSVYITANPDNLLADALEEQGREPVVDVCRWHDREDAVWPQSVWDTEPEYEPSIERPLVYHVFGQLRYLDSLVLTEDDYFDYLIGVSRNRERIPSPVSKAWSRNALLFLGFQIEEWNFRVLLRTVMSQEGGLFSLRNKRKHVAVQIDPEEGSSVDPRRAKVYLQDYLQTSNILIRWVSAEQFMADLWFLWQQQGYPARGAVAV